MISVIIPAYNCSKTIVNTLESVRNQTSIDKIKEVIVVNDGSTDETLEILNNYKSTYLNFPLTIQTQKNGGVSSARNLGIQLASQEWIALLDSDDCWLPTKIEMQLKVIEKYSEINFIGAGRNKEELTLGKKVESNLYKLEVKDLLKKVWPHTSTSLIKKKVFNEIGVFDENRTHSEDGQLWLKIASKYPLYYISSSLEIAGENKISYGISGLSADLKAMHNGCLLNIKEVYERKEINFIEMLFYSLLEDIKYVRRKILTAWRKR